MFLLQSFVTITQFSCSHLFQTYNNQMFVVQQRLFEACSVVDVSVNPHFSIRDNCWVTDRRINTTFQSIEAQTDSNAKRLDIALFQTLQSTVWQSYCKYHHIIICNVNTTAIKKTVKKTTTWGLSHARLKGKDFSWHISAILASPLTRKCTVGLSFYNSIYLTTTTTTTI